MASAAACDVWERERASSGSEKADKDDDSLPYGAAFAAYNVALPVGWWGGAPAFVAPHQIVCEVTSNREFEREAQCLLIRDIFGNPFRPVDAAWLKRRQGKVPKIAQRIYDARAFADLPILADALEEAGCTNAELLAHCRHPGPHVRGCWAVDLILGKS